MIDDVLEELDREAQEAIVAGDEQVEEVDWPHARAVRERAPPSRRSTRPGGRIRSSSRRGIELVDCSGAERLQELSGALGLLAHQLRPVPVHHTGPLSERILIK